MQHPYSTKSGRYVEAAGVQLTR